MQKDWFGWLQTITIPSVLIVTVVTSRQVLLYLAVVWVIAWGSQELMSATKLLGFTIILLIRNVCWSTLTALVYGHLICLSTHGSLQGERNVWLLAPLSGIQDKDQEDTQSRRSRLCVRVCEVVTITQQTIQITDGMHLGAVPINPLTIWTYSKMWGLWVMISPVALWIQKVIPVSFHLTIIAHQWWWQRWRHTCLSVCLRDVRRVCCPVPTSNGSSKVMLLLWCWMRWKTTTTPHTLVHISIQPRPHVLSLWITLVRSPPACYCCITKPSKNHHDLDYCRSAWSGTQMGIQCLCAQQHVGNRGGDSSFTMVKPIRTDMLLSGCIPHSRGRLES